MDTFLELKHLKTLLALAETGTVSTAAQRLFVTQSALSHQIRSIEEHFNVSLFERKSSPLRFTIAGERLLRLAQEITPLISEAERDIVQIVEGEAGELRIAVECHTCFDWLMPAMDLFRSLWPKVELDIVSGFHSDPVGLLLTHRADIAIVSDMESQAGVSYKPLFSYEMVGICAADHPLAQKAIWEASDFKEETLITYPVPDDMLDLIRKVLRPANIEPKKRLSELTIAIIQLVASRRGIAALPYWTVLPYLQKGYVVAKQIGQTPLRSNLYAAIRENQKNIAYLNDFIKIVQDQSFMRLPGLIPLTN
ncbi:LysR family transcriptional regulator [Pelistega indica]|uniref:HTH-type transcriptional regulator MetR n=1 Tax=Pelistega indica TaxID=1414851 RepID=V8G9C7_9BURK|nr:MULTISPECIES: LysR family transcriptional regulator [Pelistega]ETD73134.1 LysR family transcriptional regulator [Pelistega indica]